MGDSDSGYQFGSGIGEDGQRITTNSLSVSLRRSCSADPRT
jgi:hypothetical protein